LFTEEIAKSPVKKTSIQACWGSQRSKVFKLETQNQDSKRHHAAVEKAKNETISSH